LVLVKQEEDFALSTGQRLLDMEPYPYSPDPSQTRKESHGSIVTPSVSLLVSSSETRTYRHGRFSCMRALSPFRSLGEMFLSAWTLMAF